MVDRDLGIEILLDLDGVAFAVDVEGRYTVRVSVRQVQPTPERPHGLRYSLTLHDESGARLVGFDNAHAAPRRTAPRPVARDHRHRIMTTRDYKYQDAATLLADFWAEVDSVLRELGVVR